MSRYGTFRGSDDLIPSTQFEACVFLDSAIRHVWNQGGETHEAFAILHNAHNEINASEWEAA